VTPAGLPDGLRVSASERAVLELLYDVCGRRLEFVFFQPV